MLSYILSLPSEIIHSIATELPNVKSIINLTLTCKSIGLPILDDLGYILKQNHHLNLNQIFNAAIVKNKHQLVSLWLPQVDLAIDVKQKLFLEASKKGLTEIVGLLLKRGVDQETKTKALKEASGEGHQEILPSAPLMARPLATAYRSVYLQ